MGFTCFLAFVNVEFMYYVNRIEMLFHADVIVDSVGKRPPTGCSLAFSPACQFIIEIKQCISLFNDEVDGTTATNSLSADYVATGHRILTHFSLSICCEDKNQKKMWKNIAQLVEKKKVSRPRSYCRRILLSSCGWPPHSLTRAYA